MTPGARLSAAITVLDQILEGQPAGVTLTNWGRQSRYAGSRDRAAVRDIVFDCLRSLRSYVALGGARTGRAVVLAYAQQSDLDVPGLFSGEAYAPPQLSQAEADQLAHPPQLSDAQRLNFPDFLEPELRRSLGADFEPVLRAMLSRAPVDLRVNRMKCTPEAAAARLEADDIRAVPVEGLATALRITENPRRLAQSRAYRDGYVELQDASSQAAAQFAGAVPGMRILDYCAGGGGKALALYDEIKGQGSIVAHDIATVRMNDLPMRAARAGARITIAGPGHKALEAGGFDLVFVDAPCSGTGSWRRTPDAKWRLTAQNLENVKQIQTEVLRRAKDFVRPGGTLCYATCSILTSENADQIASFLEETPHFSLSAEQVFTPLNLGDGFYVARLECSGAR